MKKRKKLLKKVMCVLMLLVVVLSLAGCKKSADNDKESEETGSENKYAWPDHELAKLIPQVDWCNTTCDENNYYFDIELTTEETTEEQLEKYIALCRKAGFVYTSYAEYKGYFFSFSAINAEGISIGIYKEFLDSDRFLLKIYVNDNSNYIWQHDQLPNPLNKIVEEVGGGIYIHGCTYEFFQEYVTKCMDMGLRGNYEFYYNKKMIPAVLSVEDFEKYTSRITTEEYLEALEKWYTRVTIADLPPAQQYLYTMDYPNININQEYYILVYSLPLFSVESIYLGLFEEAGYTKEELVAANTMAYGKDADIIYDEHRYNCFNTTSYRIRFYSNNVIFIDYL